SLVHVQEDWARQRAVRPVLHRLVAGQHGPLAVVIALLVDPHQAQSVTVGRVIGVAKEAEGYWIPAHTLHEHVVVLAGREVASARVLRAHHGQRKIVVRARVHSWTEEM